MKKCWKWYVYELVDDAGVFYVGKGTGNRIETTRRQGSPAKKLRAKTCRAEIVAYFKNEADAFEFEKERMRLYSDLTNVSGYENLASIKALAESLISKVYRNVRYTHPVHGEPRQLMAQLVETISEEIKSCHEVARARELVDLLGFAIGKLLRRSRQLNLADSRRLITCSA